MTNENIFQVLRSFIVRIWSLGNTTYIYSDNGVNISVNSFVLTLSLMFIVLTSLVNIVKSRGSSSVISINNSIKRKNNGKE